MRKATIDALLLTVLIIWFLLVTGVLFSYPWLIVVIYALAYALTVVLRLRQAAHETTKVPGQEHSLEEASQNPLTIKSLIGVMLYWGNHPR
jgi:hypothetical protein